MKTVSATHVNPQHFRIQNFSIFWQTKHNRLICIVMAEALGWFNNSVQRIAITAAMEQQLKEKLPQSLRKEMTKQSND